MESQEFIDFHILRKFISIEDPSLLNTYLKEVYKDLADRGEPHIKKGISKITFLEYIKLPVFIADKLFISFDNDNDGYLNSREFVENLCYLYLGNFFETIKIIFNLLDFDKDGAINKGDVKVLLSYLPLKIEKNKAEYKYQLESLSEIDDILKITFGKSETLKLDKFIKNTETKKSDIYLQLICFLYHTKPFKDQNINMLKYYKKRNTEIQMPSSPEIKKNLPSPNRRSILSPVDSILKIYLTNTEESPERQPKNLKNIKKEFSSPEISGLKGMLRMSNQRVALEKFEDINSNIKNSKNYFNSPTSFFKRGERANGKISDFNLEENLIKMEELNIDDTSEEKFPIKINNCEILYENFIYKLSETQKIKKYWLVISGKDIYYYKSQKKEEILGMHNLSGCFVKESSETKINNEKMFSFTIQFSSKTRNYYNYNKESCMEWVRYLKESIGYKSFFDYYDMYEDIGQGKFGVVKLGIHKNTKEKVAIKIIKKESMNEQDIELVKSEIDIMKLCRHPNIVRLLDHFENADYIFIIMECLVGGDLDEYLSKMKFKISEPRAALIMYQLASGIKYLHDYGVLHRDLKPENIMLSDRTDKGIIKIMDFGLSKIMGPLERVADGFGTLSFVAPEVLIRQPYNKQIDIWSLGVILYYILSGTLPFDDENDNEEKIAKMTVFVEVEFPAKNWSKRSEDSVELIRKCLIKNPEERLKIDDYFEQKWIKNFINRKD